MAKPSLQRIEEVFHRAADLEPEERTRFLDSECAGDGVLRAAVEELLEHDTRLGKTEAFIVSPIDRTRLDDRQPGSTPGFSEALALLRHAIEGYELVEVLGTGGMGVVFKARQLSLGRLVALKMLLSAFPVNSDQLSRFRAEAETLARLQHANIVQIYEVGEHEGRPYLVMEYVPGPNLARALAGRPQPARQAAELVGILANAIHVVHEHGIIHRDLKPANILMSGEWGLRNGEQEGEREELLSLALSRPLPVAGRRETANEEPAHSSLPTPKITDFGIAKRLDGNNSRTRSGAVLGTPSYMAPEQAEGRRGVVGPATDVYALGAILYEMLTGRPPFDGASPAETIAQVLNEEPISPARLRPTLPRDLVTISLKCLEKEPRKRYVTAKELTEDLSRFLAGEPIRARRVGTPERVWRWCRRRPLVAALMMTTGLLAVALVLTVVIYQSLLQHALVKQLEQKTYQLQDSEQQAEQKGALAEDERRQLSRLHGTLGARQMEEGDPSAALLRLTEALRLCDHDQEHRQRLWISLILQHCPRLTRVSMVERRIAGVQCSASGCWLATITENRALRLDDLMKPEVRTLPGAVQAGDESMPLAVSPDGRFVAVESADGSIRVWDLRSGQPHTPSLHHRQPLLWASFSTDDHLLIAHLANHASEVWDLTTGRQIPLEAAETQSTLYTAASTNGQWLFTASADGTGRVWHLPDGKALAAPMPMSQAVLAAAVRADGRQLAILDEAKTLWIYDLDSRKKRLLARALDSDGVVKHMQWSPDGRLLLAVDSHSRVHVWDAASSMSVTLSLAHAGRLLSANFSGHDSVLTVEADGKVRIWQVPQQQAETVRSDKGDAGVTYPRVRQPIRLASGKTVQVKTPSTGAFVQSPLAHEQVIAHAAFSPDGERVLTAGEDADVLIWDSHTGRQLTPAMGHQARVVYAVFSPDGSRVATACADGTASVWDVATGAPIGFPLKGSHDLERVAFRENGNQIVMIGKAGILKTWDLAPETRPLAELIPLAEAMSGRRITADGTMVPLEARQVHAAWESWKSSRTAAPGQ
jgi:WD40 repeat protein/serine/threonine protein kinase